MTDLQPDTSLLERMKNTLIGALSNTTRRPAQFTLYGLAGGALALGVGVGLPPTLAVLASGVGANALYDILKQVAEGKTDSEHDKAIEKALEKTVKKLRSRNSFASLENQRALGDLIADMALIQHAIDRSEIAVLIAISKQSEQYVGLVEKLSGDLSLINAKVDAILLEIGGLATRSQVETLTSLVHEARKVMQDMRDQLLKPTSLSTKTIPIANEAVSSRNLTAYEYCERAVISEDDRATAIADYTEAIRLSPELAVAYNNRGIIYLNNSNLSAALSDFDKAIQLEPTEVQGYINRAFARFERGDLSGAFKDATEALRLDPLNVDAYSQRSAVRAAKGDLVGALADANEVLRLDPQNVEGHIIRGNIRIARGDYNEAIADYERILELKPSPGVAHLTMIRIRELKEKKRARRRK